MALDPRTSVDHYENFPVASLALPARLRAPIAVIYRFARSADDLADEGDAPAAVRLEALQRYIQELDRLAAGATPQTPLFAALRDVIVEHRLPYAPFYDLLDAFKQDVTTHRYPDAATLLDYCRRSANPVGGLMLHLYQAATPANMRHSDEICSALQLINFWQDIAIDWRNGRLYIPQDELRRFEVSEDQIARGQIDAAWRALFDFQVARARAMLERGSPLGVALPGRIGLELRMIIAGGLRVATKLAATGGDVFTGRPRLGGADWVYMLWAALTRKAARSRAVSRNEP